MKKILVLLMTSVLLISCKTTEKPEIKDDPKAFLSVEKKRALKYFDIVKNINNNRPISFSCSMKVKIIADGKKYNASGLGYCKTEPFKIKIRLNDNIFRFKVLEMAISDSKVQAYYPLEKSFVIDNFSMNADEINSTGQNSSVLAALFSGKIPVISELTVNRVFHPEKEGEADKSQIILELENDKFIQIVSFKDDLPALIKVTDKENNTNYSIKYSKPYYNDKYLFYENVEIISQKPYMYLNVDFYNLKIQNDLKGSLFRLKRPSGVKLYDYTK